MGWKLCPNSNELFSVSRVHRTDKELYSVHMSSATVLAATSQEFPASFWCFW